MFAQIYMDKTSAMCYFCDLHGHSVTVAQQLNHAPDIMILGYLHDFLFAYTQYSTYRLEFLSFHKSFLLEWYKGQVVTAD